MEVRQLTLDLWGRDRSLQALRGHLVGCGLLSSDVDLLVAIAAADQKREGESLCCKSRRGWEKAIGHAGTTAVRAMRRLQAMGLLVYEVSSKGYAVLVEWAPIWNLTPPADPRERLRSRFRGPDPGGGAGVVRGGAASGARVLEVIKETRGTCNRVSERAPVRTSAKPWAMKGGLSGQQLREAVADRDEATLTGLYWAGIEAGWWEDCEDYRVRFLALCHHAATMADRSPMGMLTHLVRGGRGRPVMDVSRIRQESEDWACDVRREWRAEKHDRSAVGDPAEVAERARVLRRDGM